MAIINLRDYYPFYTSDCFMEVSEEVAEMFKEFDRKEAAYRLRTYRHKAYYSLDRDDGLEHEAVFVALSPHELYPLQGLSLSQPGCGTSFIIRSKGLLVKFILIPPYLPPTAGYLRPRVPLRSPPAPRPHIRSNHLPNPGPHASACKS